MKKKILGLMFVLFMLSFMPVIANAAESGNCGDDLTWTLDDVGTLTISGKGTMWSYSSPYRPPWYNSRSSITKVVIEQGVTSIGWYAFEDCSSMTSVTIPDSVTWIGDAFVDCSGLKDVHITDIAKWCDIYFYDYDSNPMHYADNLYVNNVLTTDLIIPDGVTRIGNYAFCGCSGLTSVTIPGSVTSVGWHTFDDCSSLDSVYISDLATYLSISFYDGASNPMYYADKLYLNGERIAGTVQIPDGVTGICLNAFNGCDEITSIVIPDSVTSIDWYAFSGCSNLIGVTIPNSVTSIEIR